MDSLKKGIKIDVVEPEIMYFLLYVFLFKEEWKIKCLSYLSSQCQAIGFAVKCLKMLCMLENNTVLL